MLTGSSMTKSLADDSSIILTHYFLFLQNACPDLLDILELLRLPARLHASGLKVDNYLIETEMKDNCILSSSAAAALGCLNCHCQHQPKNSFW